VTPTAIAVGILAVVGLAIIAFLIVSANRRRARLEDIPPGLRPAYSDEELERNVLENYMLWGVVMVLILAVFFPLYMLREDARIRSWQERFFVESVVHGEQEYGLLCAECHGPAGEGGVAPVPGQPGETWPAPNLRNIVVRYEDNPNVTDMRRFLHATIEQGRPGTPMPAWGSAFNGPLTDQQIEWVVDWILANQEDEPLAEPSAAQGVSGEELYTQNCAKCHGAELQGDVAPPLIGVFERHSDESVLQVLRNGIKVPTGAIMPPWQVGYMYPDARFTDDALQRIIDFLHEQQPDDPQPHDGTIGPPRDADEPADEQPADA
jgi:mono/diheme cytochrome c family protein